MKTIQGIGVVAVAILLWAFVAAETLEIGAGLPAEQVEMKGIDGDSHTLEQLKGENGLLVVFSCNTCPWVVGSEGSDGWDGPYNQVYQQCQEMGIGMVLINSNEAKREKGDSMEDMIAYAGERNFEMTYLLDKDHVVADAFGARTTPHIFLFGNNNLLEYKGAIDDNVGDADAVKGHWLRNAMQSVKDGKKPDPNATRNKGCSIKRVKQSE